MENVKQEASSISFYGNDCAGIFSAFLFSMSARNIPFSLVKISHKS